MRIAFHIFGWLLVVYALAALLTPTGQVHDSYAIPTIRRMLWILPLLGVAIVAVTARRRRA